MLERFPASALDEAREFNRRLENLLADRAPPGTVPVEEVRRLRAEGGGAFPAPVRLDHATTRSIRGSAGPITLRLLVPPRPAGLYLYFHGGGWFTGGADQHDLELWALAQATGLAVASAEYRLAPEHPFPAAIDDCEAAARWAVDEGRREFGGGPLLIGGESSGAHLAVATLLRLRDRHGAAGAVGAVNLVFGIYDLSLTPSVRAWGDRRLVLDRPIIDWFVEAFTPGFDAEARRDPEVSPLYADLGGLPPARLTVGVLDPLLDDSTFLAARWVAAGGRAELGVYPEAAHGFTTQGTAIGRAGVEAQHRFLRQELGR